MQINCTVLIDRDLGNKRKSVISIYHNSFNKKRFASQMKREQDRL